MGNYYIEQSESNTQAWFTREKKIPFGFVSNYP